MQAFVLRRKKAEEERWEMVKKVFGSWKTVGGGSTRARVQIQEMEEEHGSCIPGKVNRRGEPKRDETETT